MTLEGLGRAHAAGALPLCAARLHTGFKRQWLHHDQRRQYVLFLRGVGLNAADALRLFQAAFERAQIDPMKPKRRLDRFASNAALVSGILPW
jgi:DNA primase large subunit